MNKHRLDHEIRGDVLLVEFPEHETADQLRPFIDDALVLSETLGVQKVIVDNTASSIALAPLDYTRVGQYIARQPGAGRLRVAIVRRPTLVTEASIGAQELVGRGLNFRVFADLREAEEWLKRPDA